MFIWKVVVSNLGSKKVYRLRGTVEMTNQQVFDRAKEFALGIKRKYQGTHVSVELVSGTKAYPPKKDSHIPKNHHWCPYCVKPRIFMEDKVLGVKRCLTCGISENDFYVKKYNHIFRKEYQDYLLSTKIKE